MLNIEEMVFHRVVDKLGFFLDIEFVHDTRAICVDRLGTEGEDRGDLAVGEAFGEVAKDFAFADAEEDVGIGHIRLHRSGTQETVDECLRDGFVEILFAFVYFVYRFDKLAVGRFFEQVSVCSRPHNFFDIFFVIVHREDEDVADKATRTDLFDAVDTAHIGHG